MSLEKEFVPYELTLELKKLGFDEECLKHYCKHWKDDLPYLRDQSHPSYPEHWQENTTINAPLWQQAFDWFREKHNLTSEQSIEQHRRKTDKKWMYSITWLIEDAMYTHSKITYSSYQEARLACLEKLIEIVKNK